MGTLFTGKSLRSAVFLNFTNENVKNILEKKTETDRANKKNFEIISITI